MTAPRGGKSRGRRRHPDRSPLPLEKIQHVSRSQEVFGLFGGQGFGKQVALPIFAMQRSQPVQLLRGFNAFRDRI